MTVFSRQETVDRLSGIFSFDNHINGICRKTNQKFHTLMRIVKCISEGKTRTLESKTRRASQKAKPVGHLRRQNP